MDRDIKIFNRPVMSKIHKKNQQLHLQRLRNIKSGISNRTMPYNNHPQISNKKAVMIEEQKKTQIEKQNVVLFNKMFQIMKRTDPNNQPRTSTAPHRNKNNVTYSRITEQNKGIFQRLQQQRPTISNKKLQEERVKNLNILRFLGKYPNPGVNKASYDSSNSNVQPKKRLNSTAYRGYDEEQLLDEVHPYQQRQIGTASGGRKKYLSQAIEKKTKLAKINSEETDEPVKNQKMGFHQPQILLYQQKQPINGKLATVEFYRFYSEYQIIAHFDKEIHYDLVIPESEGNQFFSEYSYDYKKICGMLMIEDGNLVVDIPSNKVQVEREAKIIEMDKPTQIEKWHNYEEALEQSVQ